MAISRKEVEYVAHLARIRLDSVELKRFTQQLEEILGYINKLKALKLEGIEPMSHPVFLKNVFREDKIRPSFSSQEALKNAPEREGDFFKVPKVIE